MIEFWVLRFLSVYYLQVFLWKFSWFFSLGWDSNGIEIHSLRFLLILTSWVISVEILTVFSKWISSVSPISYSLFTYCPSRSSVLLFPLHNSVHTLFNFTRLLFSSSFQTMSIFLSSNFDPEEKEGLDSSPCALFNSAP